MVSTDEFVRAMIANTLAPMRPVAALQDLLARTGTIAVMSSRLGSVADNEVGGFEVRRASKAALNTPCAALSPGPRAIPAALPFWRLALGVNG